MIIAWRSGWAWRFQFLYAGVGAIGVGSAWFHGLLSHAGQQGDETPMIWTIVTWVYCLLFIDPDTEKAHPTLQRVVGVAAVLFCAAWAVVHYMYSFVLVFQGTFGAFVAVGLVMIYREWKKCDNPAARRLGVLYVVTLAFAFTLWNVDQIFCTGLHALPGGLPNPQFHAWWHVIVVSEFSGAWCGVVV